jgi:hypothetical protein
MAPVLEGKSIGSDQKTVLQGELPYLENQESGLGTKIYSPIQGFNLLQISPKLVPRKLNPGASSKVGPKTFTLPFNYRPFNIGCHLGCHLDFHLTLI